MEKLFKCLMLQVFCAININAQLVAPRDAVINEILFDPPKDGFDYVEVYNRSDHPFNVNQLLIANRNSTGEIASVKHVSKDSLLSIRPGGYFVITANEKWLRQHYAIPDSAVIIQQSLPSFPDDEGCVVLLRTSDSMIIDELKYEKSLHFKMIANPQGVALEKINYDLLSGDKNSWTSASSSSGYGTPGYINSQFRNNEVVTSVISVKPEIFSPDNDGYNDFASINIKTEGQGIIVNAVIFNAMGRRVRYFLKNETLGVDNRFIWDGYDDRNELLPSGIYIIFTQLFDTKGKVTKHRNCVVLNSFPP